ncbi:MAG: FtsW/RodA/SpoVE family cell cycle protein, partial [Rhodospirillales bacterium]|nr:FtsW/RodA/SpoVE family cell cycle protein [Rhodospirillales bacterium]
MAFSPGSQPEMTLGQKFWNINWLFVLLVVLTASVGFALLYSAANGSFTPWASRQMIRFAVGLVVMLCVAVIHIRIWLRYAYVIYAFGLVLLGVVEVAGTTGMGARRWINLGVINVQPSEIAKIAVILVLARYFYAARIEDVRRLTYMFFPALLIAAPAYLVLRQPDLGTAILIIAGGVAL